MGQSEVAARLSDELGIGISVKRLEALTRSWPVRALPPLVRGRREWSEEHVARLREQILRREGQRAAKAGAEA